jgi:hypothetical protein
MAPPPTPVADPDWQAWLAQGPDFRATGNWEDLHRSSIPWLRRAPPTGQLSRGEADLLTVHFLLLSRRLKRGQSKGVSTTGAVFAGAIVGLVGYATGGPVGALAAPLFNFCLATYTAKLNADHRRRQEMVDEVDAMIDNLIDRIRQ